MANSSSPIGIFDSGIGGTSIFKEIHRLLPSEKCIYLADSANAPYGEKNPEEIIQLSIKSTQLLINQGCKIIVVACNTATTNAIQILRKMFDVPFIGIEPAIKPAALQSKKKAIGILATKGTLSSALFNQTTGLFAKDIKVIEIVGKGLVEKIENGRVQAAETGVLLKELLQPMLSHPIDYLVLGCTHYPYLIPQLRKILPADVSIIDSGQAVAKQTETVLQSLALLATKPQGSPIFFTNKDPKILACFVNSPAEKFKVTYLDF